MARLPRVHIDGGLYYVTSRGDGAQPIFQDQGDYDAYINLIEQYRQRYGFKLFAYCLLPDHVHLCVEVSGGVTVSAVMHDITSRYTKYFNKRYARAGHLFQERFKSVLVEKAAYLLPLVTFMHVHPVRTGLVPQVADYRYSTYARYRSARMLSAAVLVEPEIREVLEQLAAAHPQHTYEEYVARFSPLLSDELREGLQRGVLGSAEFKQAVYGTQIKEVRQAAPAVQEQPEPAEGPAIGEATTPSDASAGGAFTLEPEPAAVDLSPVGRSFSHVGWIVLTEAVAAVLAVFSLSLYHKVAWLERAVVSLAQENDASFRANYSLAMQDGGSVGRMAGLSGTEWELQLVPVLPAERGLQATAQLQDRLAFTEREVASTSLAEQGFRRSKYAVNHQRDGAMAWQAMQVGPQGEIISWKGEWHDNVMRGIMTRQATGRTVENFTFIGQLRTRAKET